MTCGIQGSSWIKLSSNGIIDTEGNLAEQTPGRLENAACMSWWSVHLGLAASLGNLHPTRTGHSAAISCQRSRWKNQHLLHCIRPGTCGSRNASHPHFHVLSHPVLSRIALMPPLCIPLCGLIRSFWTDASAHTCVCHQTYFAR